MNLLDLPPELIAQIWSQLPQYDKAAKRPICRALLPLTRRALFRRVSLGSARRLQAFSQLLHPSNPLQASALRTSLGGDRPLGLNVRELNIGSIAYEPNEEDNNADCKAVQRIFSSTFGVEHLTLEGSGLLKLVLPYKECAFRFSQVHTLRLVDLDPLHVRFYDMKRLGRLRFWHGLRTLEMDCDPDWGDELDQVAHPHRAHPLSRIKSLALTAGASLSTDSAANFVSHFTALTTLTVELFDLAQLSFFLEAVSTTLTSLSISFDLDADWEIGEDGIVLDALLGRFVNLTSLTLGDQTFSSNLFRSLSGLLSLTTLSLDCGTRVRLRASRLINYLRYRPRSLRSLTLDAFSAYAGLIPSERPNHSAVVAGTLHIEQSWTLPRWTNDFPLEAAKEVVRVAAEVGIELKGTLKNAIEIEELKVREEKYLQERADDILLSLAELFSQS